MTDTPYDIEELFNKEWMQHSLYVITDRAIPSFVDGMKPSRRFYIAATLKSSKHSFEKIDSVAGSLSNLGYAHGSVSGAGAAQLMVADWYTKIPIIQGRGSFGSRLIQTPASPRYTYTRLHPNFEKYFKDFDLVVPHDDPEILIPKYYIPVIPYVLLNNTSGMATGFATNILGRDVNDVIAACKEYIQTGNITTELKYSFPRFTGKITKDAEGRVVQHGVFTKDSKNNILITEIPYMNSKSIYDREMYITILDKLEEDDKIASYDDMCDGSGFKFLVKLKRGVTYTDDEIISLFKLTSSITENLTVIMPNGKPKAYADARDLIKDFCDFKRPILQQRIDTKLVDLSEENRYKRVKAYFIQAVIDNKIVFKNKGKDDISNQILQVVKNVLDKDIDSLLRVNIAALTVENVSALAQEILDNKKEIDYWKTTTVDVQFLKDLEEI